MIQASKTNSSDSNRWVHSFHPVRTEENADLFAEYRRIKDAPDGVPEIFFLKPTAVVEDYVALCQPGVADIAGPAIRLDGILIKVDGELFVIDTDKQFGSNAVFHPDDFQQRKIDYSIHKKFRDGWFWIWAAVNPLFATTPTSAPLLKHNAMTDLGIHIGLSLTLASTEDGRSFKIQPGSASFTFHDQEPGTVLPAVEILGYHLIVPCIKED